MAADKFTNCRGIRVFYYNAYEVDLYLSKQREEEEKLRTRENGNVILTDHEHVQYSLPQRLKGLNLEAGTVTSVVCYQDEKGEEEIMTVIQWDCGFKKHYFKKDLQYMKIFDLGPAGYKGEMVICDMCLEPVMGYAWTLADKNKKLEGLYSLCCTHYNQNKDLYPQCKFYHRIPSGGKVANNRHEFQRQDCKEVYGLHGLFKGAKVVKMGEAGNQEEGEIVRISHAYEEEQKITADLSRADYFKCYAEVIWPNSDFLESASAGRKGLVEIKTVLPGMWGMIYADHHPVLGKEVFEEMVAYKDHIESHSKQCKFSISDDSLIIPCADLEDIPSSEIEWKSLKHINVYGNSIENLSDTTVSASDSMTSFCGQNNFFRKFPNILSKFTKLATINLHHNCLSELPKTFMKYPNLSQLFLGDNNLNSLPDIFASFPVLQVASFANNHLTVLPDSFKKLTKLQRLNLSYNAIVRFPEPLLNDQICMLKHLDLKHNRIQKLHSQTAELKARFEALSSLALEGNPIYMHESLLGKSPYEVLGVLRRNETLEALSELSLSHSLRVCVLGKKEAGKTSLVRSVCYNQYVLPTTKYVHRCTMGIERHYKALKLKEGHVIPLHIWDHAGSNEYDTMNDLFISSSNTLIWLVVSLKEYDCSLLSFKECVQKWLYPIMRRCRNPIVWIICTHIDECYNDHEDKLDHIKKNVEELLRNYEKCLSNSEPQNSSSGEWLESCRSAIEFLREHVKYVSLSNTYWFKGRDNLFENMEKLASEEMEIFSRLHSPLKSEWDSLIYKHLHQSAGKFESSISEVIAFFSEVLESDSEVQEFLQYCHDIGEIFIMTSKSNQGDNSYVRNMEWLISKLKMVYYWSEHCLKKCIGYRDIGRAKESIKAYGALSLNCLQQLWFSTSDEGSDDCECLVDFFIDSELAYMFEINSQSYLFFPYLIKAKESKVMVDLNTPHIKVECECFCLPRSFLQRLGLCLASVCASKELSLTQNSFEMQIHKDPFYVRISGFDSKCEDGSSESIRLHVSISPPGVADYGIMWEVIVRALDIAAELIEKEPYQFKMKSCVFCPECRANPNYLKIVNVDDDIRQTLYNQKKQCNLCKAEIPLDQLVPAFSTKKLCSEKIQSIDEFDELCSGNWIYVAPKAESTSVMSYNRVFSDFMPPVDSTQ